MLLERNDLNLKDNSFEGLWVEIMNDKNKNIVRGCLYRHPSSDIEEFQNYISNCLTKLNKEKKECYLAGDFNIDLLKYNNNKYSEFLKNRLVSCHIFYNLPESQSLHRLL